MTRGRRHLALALAAVAILLLAPAPIALGADPSPSFAPVRPPAIFQACSTPSSSCPTPRPVASSRPGSRSGTVAPGISGEIGGIYARLKPAQGDAPPSEATIEPDFPGHVIASFVVPEGGPGDVEVGMLIDACTEAGCGEADAPFTISGVGPPPEADPAALVTAQFLPFVGDTVAGRTFPVAVNIQPRGLWDFTALPLPDALEVVASHPGEPALASAPLLPGAQPGDAVTGRLTIPETGPVELTVQVPNPDGVAGVVAGEPRRARGHRGRPSRIDCAGRDGDAGACSACCRRRRRWRFPAAGHPRRGRCRPHRWRARAPAGPGRPLNRAPSAPEPVNRQGRRSPRSRRRSRRRGRCPAR